MKKRILVIEDDWASLKLLKEILERYDYDVIDAMDGINGIELAKKYLPNLAIVDIMLPKMNGYQVCEKLREISDIIGIPIIVLTALNEDQHRIRAIEAGATDFLSKPFARVELLTKIKALLTMQETFLKSENFDDILYCLIQALYLRNEKIKIHSRRVAYLAEQIAVRKFINTSEINEMKKAILIQDIGQLCTNQDINFLGDILVKDNHPEMGYLLLKKFHRDLIQNIVRYHHANLKAENYPKDLPDNMKDIINIVALANRFEQINQTKALPNIEATMNFIGEETNNGLWDKECYILLEQAAKTNGFK